MDLIVLNSLKEEGAGFGYDTNKITIIDRNNNIDKFELKSKEDAAKDILDKIVSMIQLNQSTIMSYRIKILSLYFSGLSCLELFRHRN